MESLISIIHSVREHPDLFNAAIALDGSPVEFSTRTFAENELEGFKHTPFLRMFYADWRNLGATPKDAQFELDKNNYFSVLSPNQNNTSYTTHMSYSDISTLYD